MPELNSTEVFKGKISSDLGHQKLSVHNLLAKTMN